MIKCKDCKDTGKIFLLCQCKNKLTSCLSTTYGGRHYNFYTRSIILPPCEIGCLLSLSSNDPTKELPIEIKSISIGNKIQALPCDINIWKLFTCVSWEEITDTSPLKIEIRNVNNERIYVSSGLWAE